jgi:hypothetical protein
MKRSSETHRYLREFILLFFVAASSFAHSQTAPKQILDLKVDSFPTGLEEVGNSFWVDENQFVMTTLQEGAQRDVDEEKTPMRIALINFKTKTIKYIAQDAKLLEYTFDHKTRSIFIGKTHSTVVIGPDKRATSTTEYENLREIRIEPDGQVIEIKNYPPGSEPRRPEPPPKARRFRSLDQGRGGYLITDVQPGDTLEALNERDRLMDEGWPTVWVRPGKPDIHLPIRFDEVGSGVYVAFLDKYQLSDYDTASASWTNSNRTYSVWKRPYEYTPFRLLGQDGSLVEIPYPEFVFEYGIADRQYKGGHFGRLLVTKAGIVIQKRREYGSALYLFKSDQLYLVAGGKTSLKVDMAKNSAEGIQTTRLSPDGCKLSYSHLKALVSMSKYRAPHFFNIIDVCSEQK